MAYKQPSSGPFKMMGSSPAKHPRQDTKDNHVHNASTHHASETPGGGKKKKNTGTTRAIGYYTDGGEWKHGKRPEGYPIFDTHGKVSKDVTSKYNK